MMWQPTDSRTLQQMDKTTPATEFAATLVGTGEELLHRALELLKRGDAPQAAFIAARVAEQQPENPSAWAVLSAAARSTNDVSVALDAADRALALIPERPEYLELRALALEKVRPAQHAVDAWKAVVARRPGVADPLLALARCQEAAGRRADAVTALRAASRLAPGSALPHYVLGNVLSRAGRHEHAVRAYDAALALDAAYVEAHYNRAAALRRLNRNGQAVEALQAALALREAWPEAHTALAALLRDLGRNGESLAHAERALALAPTSSAALNNKGLALLSLRRAGEALACFDRALDLKGPDAEILNNRGLAFADLGQTQAAVGCYREAIALQSGRADIRLNLANALRTAGNDAEALAQYNAALTIAPDDHRLHGSLAAALIAMGRPRQAVTCYRHALAIAAHAPPDDVAELRKGLGIAQLTLGRMRMGWKNYEWRERCRDFVGRTPVAPRWEGVRAPEGPLLVRAEQGFGDTLQFCRYLPMLAERHPDTPVHFEVQPQLVRIMHSLRGPRRIFARGEGLRPCAAEIPLLSLPAVFGTSLATIPHDVPYLRADSRSVETWRTRLKGARSVGLAWAGNPRRHDDRLRSCPVEALAPILEVPDLTFVDLQVDLDAAGRERPHLLRSLVPAAADFADFSDTAAVIEALDLVIAVDTAVAHLAGALGRPVWVLLGYAADWRFLRSRSDSPWYPTMRLFRQPHPEGWLALTRAVAAALAAAWPAPQ